MHSTVPYEYPNSILNFATVPFQYPWQGEGALAWCRLSTAYTYIPQGSGPPANEQSGLSYRVTRPASRLAGISSKKLA